MEWNGIIPTIKKRFRDRICNSICKDRNEEGSFLFQDDKGPDLFNKDGQQMKVCFIKGNYSAG